MTAPTGPRLGDEVGAAAQPGPASAAARPAPAAAAQAAPADAVRSRGGVVIATVRVAFGLADDVGAARAVDPSRGELGQLGPDAVQVIGHSPQLPPSRSRSRDNPRLTRLRTTISEQLSSDAISL